MMRNNLDRAPHQNRQIVFVPTRWTKSRRVSLIIYPRAASRCVPISNNTVAVALTGAEVRLLCARQWQVHGRMEYRIPSRTRNANTEHVPGRTAWTFNPIFVAEDSQVRIGWETFGAKRRPIVFLTAQGRTRVRARGTGISWWPSIAEIDALGRLYGKAKPPAHTTPETTHDRLQQMKADLRALLEQRHPELARRRDSLAALQHETHPRATSGPGR